MKSNNVFIQYHYSNDITFAENVPLSVVVEEFQIYKIEAYEEWANDDSTSLPRELYEITSLGFNKDTMKLETIQFSEKVHRYVKR